jgi:Tol biopolymer transport system component
MVFHANAVAARPHADGNVHARRGQPASRLARVAAATVLALALLAGCGGDDSAPTQPDTFTPTKFTVFTSDRGRAAGSYRNYISGLDDPGTFAFTLGTGSALVDRSPSISEDGRTLAYQSSPGTGGSQDVFLFDRITGILTDDPNLNTAANETDPFLSLDGRRLAFVRDTLGDRRVRLYNLQTRRFIPLPGIEAGPGTNDSAPTLDETGQRIAFVSTRGGSNDVLVYVVATATLLEPEFMADALDDLEPSISGDGHYVCFSSNRLNGAGGYDLYMLDLNTILPVPMPNSAANERDPALSYAGTHVQFVAPGAQGGLDLFLLDRAVGTPTQVSGQSGPTDDFSPVMVWR